METFSPKERSINFGREEKERFKKLIDKYKTILFNKKTDTANNLQKKRTWNAIHAEFNALSDNPQTVKPLQAKFDNMKRNARKDASKQRQEQFKTGSGPPPPPAGTDTEWLRTVMPISMDGLPSTVDDDSQISGEETATQVLPILNKMGEYSQKVEIEHSNEKNEIDQKEIETTKENHDSDDTTNIQKEVFNTKSPACLLRTPVSKSLKVQKKSVRLSDMPSGSKSQIDSQISTERLELFRNCRKFEKEIFELRVQHLNEKRKEDKRIFDLQEKKLLLEISLLEKIYNSNQSMRKCILYCILIIIIIYYIIDEFLNDKVVWKQSTLAPATHTIVQ